MSGMRFVRQPATLLCLALLVAAGGLLFSCSQPSAASVQSLPVTLQELSAGRTALVPWTAELEKPPVAVTAAGNADSSVAVTPQNVFAAQPDLSPLYPSIAGFASLDVSSLDPVSLSVLRRFCAVMCLPERSWSQAETLMRQDQAYAFVVFLYDFARYVRSLGLDPADGGCVTSFVLGAPFAGDTLVQCPVRLILDGGLSADIVVWLWKDGGTVRIGRITWQEEVG